MVAHAHCMMRVDVWISFFPALKIPHKPHCWPPFLLKFFNSKQVSKREMNMFLRLGFRIEGCPGVWAGSGDVSATLRWCLQEEQRLHMIHSVCDLLLEGLGIQISKLRAEPESCNQVQYSGLQAYADTYLFAKCGVNCEETIRDV